MTGIPPGAWRNLGGVIVAVGVALAIGASGMSAAFAAPTAGGGARLWASYYSGPAGAGGTAIT